MSKNNDKARSIFFPYLSHNIRQPLNSVIDAIALLLEKDLSLTQSRYLETVNDQANDLLMLINDILDLTRIEQGNFNLINERFDLRAALQGVANLIARDARNANIDFEYFIHPEVHTWVRGDVGRLRQVLTNLGWLSLTQSSGSSTMLDVTVEEDKKDSVKVRCSISDTTSRLSPKLIELLNVCESDRDMNALESHPDVCLRMMLSKRLAEMMGGDFAIEAEESAGATYHFSATLAKSVFAAGHEDETDAELKNVRIMLIDEDDESRAEMEEMIHVWGAKVLALPNCDAAYMRLRETASIGESFDLVIISTQLKGQDAENFARAVKSDSLVRDISIILVAPVGRRGDAARLQQVGISGYLTKPTSQRQVRRCIKFVLARKDSGESPKFVTRHVLSELSRSRIRVIIVEENSVHQLSLRRMIEKLGFDPEIVAEPDVAISLLKENAYDLAFLDLSMKGFNGKRAAGLIRGRSDKAVCVVGMMTRAPKNEGKSYIDAGFDEVVVRPIRDEGLLEILEKVVQRINSVI